MPPSSTAFVASLVPGVSIELNGSDGDWKLATLTRSDGRSLLLVIAPEDSQRRFEKPEDALAFFRQKYFPLPADTE